jgi:hypothetical protein
LSKCRSSRVPSISSRTVSMAFQGKTGMRVLRAGGQKIAIDACGVLIAQSPAQIIGKAAL